MESLESKTNKLKNAWEEFLLGLANSEVIKGAVDLMTGFLTVLNKLTGMFGESGSGFMKFLALFGMFQGGKALLSGMWTNVSGGLAKQAGKAGAESGQAFY
jgi:hypothetical protein